MKTRLFLAACLVLLGGSLAGRNAFGSFQVISEPSGAVVTIAGTNIYLGTTPTPMHPVQMNHNAVWNGGVAGQMFDLRIDKDGYAPIFQRVFVPFKHQHHGSGDRNPTVFRFQLRPLPPPPSYYYPINPCPSPYNGYFYGINVQPEPRPPAKYRAKYTARGRRH